MFSELLKQNSVIVVVFILTTLYVAFAKDIMTDEMTLIVRNEFFKLAALLLIVFLGHHSVPVALAVTIIVLVSIIYSNNNKSTEGFDSPALDDTFVDASVDASLKDDDDVGDFEDTDNNMNQEEDEKCPPGMKSACVPAEHENESNEETLTEGFVDVFTKESTLDHTIDQYKQGF